MCLGLSVAASLAFVAPACALLVVHLLWSKGRTPVLVAFLTAFVLLVDPTESRGVEYSCRRGYQLAANHQ